MDRKKLSNNTIPQFTCQDDVVIFNTSLVEFNCFVIQVKTKQNQHNTCDEVCGDMNAKIPNYDEFIELNATKVIRGCSGVFCNLIIEMNFDFATHQWQSNNQQLNSLTWRSHEYPRLNDLLVVCNLASYIQQPFGNDFSDEPTPHFCTLSSSALGYNNRTDYFNWEFNQYDLTPFDAFYFCEADPFDYKSLKLGTLEQALSDCDNLLMTPNLCDSDASAGDKLAQLVKEANRLSKFEWRFMSSFIWTGTKRYNETHFRGQKWINTTQLNNCVSRNRKRNCLNTKQLTSSSRVTFVQHASANRDTSSAFSFPTPICVSLTTNNQLENNTILRTWLNGPVTGCNLQQVSKNCPHQFWGGQDTGFSDVYYSQYSPSFRERV